MIKEDRNVYMDQLIEDRKLAKTNLKSCESELETIKSEQASSLYGRREADDIDYLEKEIDRYKAEIKEIDTRIKALLREEWDEYKKEETQTLNEEGYYNIEGKKPNRRVRWIIAILIFLVAILIFIITYECLMDKQYSIFPEKRAEAATDTKAEKTQHDLENILNNYSFDKEITISNNRLSTRHFYISIDIGDDYEFEIYRSQDDTYREEEMKLTFYSEDYKSPVSIEDENIKLLTCDIMSYLCGENVVSTEDIDSFLSGIPERKYTENDSYWEELCDYNEKLDGGIEYTSSDDYFHENGRCNGLELYLEWSIYGE